MTKASHVTLMIAAAVMAMMCQAASAAHADEYKMKTKVKVRLEHGFVRTVLRVKGQDARYVTVGQVKDDLLAGTEKFAQGATKVTEINLDPSTMDMVGHGHGPHAEVAKKLTLMVVHTYSYDKPGMYREEDVQALLKKLQDGSWSCPIHTRDKDRSTDICSRTAGDHETNEMVIFTTSPQKLTFIHMAGKMSLAELEEASGGAGGVYVYPMAPMPPIHPMIIVHPPTPPTPPAAPSTPPQ